MLKYFKIGKVVSPHGLMGEIKVYPTTEDIGRFEYLKSVFIEEEGSYREIKVKRVKYLNKFVVIKLNGIDRIEEAEKLKDIYLYVDRENAIELDEDTYYVADLIGIDVFSDGGEEIGQITSVFKTGSNDVYVIKRNNGKEALIPAIGDVVLSVDINDRKMIIKVLEGLL